MVDINIIEKVIDNIIYKNKFLIVKCHENSTTIRGKNAKIIMLEDYGEKVPLRHLQDKGYNSKGEHLGYIARIEYPDGTLIDFVNGTLTIDNHTYQMGFDDNYKIDSRGNFNHILKGSANGLFKRQRKEINNQENGKNRWKTVLDYGSLMRNGLISKQLNSLFKKNIDIHDDEIRQYYKGTRLGKLISDFDKMNNIAHNTSCDYEDIAVGQQIQHINLTDRRRINDTTGPNMTSTSVGFLNDKYLMKHNTITNESKSIDGNTYNWDNTYKVYTVIPKGSGARGVYLGYAQNEKIGVWDNSGNIHNELVLPANQKMKKLLVDEENGIIIQTPVMY